MTIETAFYFHFFGDLWWIVILCVTLPGAAAAGSIFFTDRRNFNMLLIVLASLCVNIIYLLYTTGFSYLPTRDAIYHFQVVNMILQAGQVPFGAGIGEAWEYSYYPLFHILTAATSLVTGAAPLTVLVSFSLLTLMYPVLAYLLTKRIFKSDKIALLAALVYVYEPAAYPNTGYRLLAMIFFYFFLVYFFRQEKLEAKHVILAVVFLLVLSGTNHLAFYFMLGLVILLYCANYFRIPTWLARDIEIRSYRFSSTNFCLVLVAGLVWGSLVALAVSGLHLKELWYVYFFGLLSGEEAPRNIGFFSPAYSILETTFISVTLFMVVLIGLIGFLSYVRTDVADKRFTTYATYFAAFFFLGFATRNFNETAYAIWARLWEPFFLAVSISFAYFAVRVSRIGIRSRIVRPRIDRNLGKAFFMIVVVCLSISYGLVIPRELIDFQFERQRGVIIDMRGEGSLVYRSAVWFSEHASKHYAAIADSPIHDFLEGYFGATVVYSWSTYTNPSSLREYLESSEGANVRYLFVDQLLAQYDESPTMLTYVKAVARENLILLTATQSCVYNNGLVQLCYISSD
jgi:hypothetical protein